MEKNRGQKNVVVLFLLAWILLFNFVLADTECIGRDCSIDIALSVQKISAFNGSVSNLTGYPISNANVSVLGTSYSTLTSGGIYNINEELSGYYDLMAFKNGYLSQSRYNQLAEYGETRQADFILGRLGGIKGNVRDFWTSSSIDNANLSLFLYDEFLNSTLTNAGGYYEFTGLAPGYYDIYVTKTGFNSAFKLNNQILGGANTTIDFWLW